MPAIIPGFTPVVVLGVIRFVGFLLKNRLAAVSLPKYSCLVSHLENSEERRRLAKNYASMTDDELQHLARHSDSLTESAGELLEDEFDHRHLDWPEDESLDPSEQLELQQLVTIRQFRDLPEALLAKGSLESAGIECFLADENLVRLDWFISNLIGGIKLSVKAQDAESARQILDDGILEGLYVQGVGLYEQPRCPTCQSLDVNFQELDHPIAYMSAFLRIPLPVQKKAWHCHTCDSEWEDDEGGSEVHS
jgi:hypothetical protein